jgi:hypothetical protein
MRASSDGWRQEVHGAQSASASATASTPACVAATGCRRPDTTRSSTAEVMRSLWEVEQFAYLVRQLKAAPDANGSSVLDNSLVFFSSEIEDGDSHSHDNMPILVAGKAGGRVQGGRHLRFTGAPTVANLFLSMTEALGAPQTSFGDSTGLLPGFITAA